MAPNAAVAATELLEKNLQKEMKDLLILIKWSDATATSVSEDEINNKILPPQLSKAHITKLCPIVRKPGGGEDGHKVLMIAEDNLKLAVYWVQHQIRIS